MTDHPTAVLQGLQVLIADDDVDACELMKFTLEMYGVNVQVTFSAHQAYEAFVRSKPHIVISDIAMPDEDGYSLIRRMREFELISGSITPAIAVTANDIASEDEVRLAGFQKRLLKPFDLDELVAVVAKLAETDFS